MVDGVGPNPKVGNLPQTKRKSKNPEGKATNNYGESNYARKKTKPAEALFSGGRVPDYRPGIKRIDNTSLLIFIYALQSMNNRVPDQLNNFKNSLIESNDREDHKLLVLINMFEDGRINSEDRYFLIHKAGFSEEFIDALEVTLKEGDLTHHKMEELIKRFPGTSAPLSAPRTTSPAPSHQVIDSPPYAPTSPPVDYYTSPAEKPSSVGPTPPDSPSSQPAAQPSGPPAGPPSGPPAGQPGAQPSGQLATQPPAQLSDQPPYSFEEAIHYLKLALSEDGRLNEREYHLLKSHSVPENVLLSMKDGKIDSLEEQLLKAQDFPPALLEALQRLTK